MRKAAAGEAPSIDQGRGLAALALRVAESAPKDKEVMTRLVRNRLVEPAV